ncbi:MAG: hypothetical protein FJ403_01620 [Verrucomicrobia bacterium]|nr:hypothetical protein [Verrucomicrobiota bacterium]
MKKMLLGLSVAGLFLAAATTTFGADKEIKGEAQCPKCSLKKADTCAEVIVAKEDGKEVVYHVVRNDLAKKDLPHKLICTAKKKVEAKGSIKEVEGKKELTLSSIKVIDEK